MVPGRVPPEGKDRSGGDVAAERSHAAIFALLWDSLADLLGSAATATLVRRAVTRAVGRCPELAELLVARNHLDYVYTVPSSWENGVRHSSPALHELVRELRPLLVDLTGTVVINHLERIPALREHGLIFAQEEQS